MDLLAWGLAALFFMLLLDLSRNTPALTLWLAQLTKRPAVQIFYPEGRSEFILLKKDEEYSKGIYVGKLNVAFTRTPGSVYLLNNKIPFYVVYVPFGKTVHPAWIKAQAVAMQVAGVKSVREVFQRIHELETSGVVEQASLVIETLGAKKEKKLTDEEKAQLEQATRVVEEYRRLRHAADIIGQIYSTLSPQVLEELVVDSDASANAQMIKDAETQERVRAMDYIKKLGLTQATLLIFFAGLIGLIIIWALVNPGGTPDVISAGAQVAQNVAGAKTAAGASAGAQAATVNV